MSGTITAAVVVLTVLGALGANTLRGPMGWSMAAHTPVALTETLSPYYRITKPRGAGPFPTALLFSGCDGPKDNLDVLARALAETGWASIIVDSHGPRAYDRFETWRLICSGQLLTGAERAGDVAVAIDDARGMAFVDADRIALIGASHGGWAVLDFLALASEGRVPPILEKWPDSFLERGVSGIRRVVALYPYCGVLSIAANDGWQVDVPTLFLLVDGDAIADDQDCRRLASREQSRGLEVEVGMFRGVTHGFDQAEKSALSTLAFDPAARAAAVREITAFLER
jgi:dienelactone hydrolase